MAIIYGQGERKEIPDFKEIIQKHKKLSLHLSVYQCVLEVFKNYTMLFQRDESLIHKVYAEQHQLVRTFFSFFVKPDVLSAVKRGKDLLQLDLKVEKKLKKLIYIRSGATRILKKNPNSFVVQKFLKVTHEACLKSGKYILKKLPLNNEVIRKFSCIDPAIVTSPSTAIVKTYLSYPTLVRNVILDEQNVEYKKEVTILLSNGQLNSHVQTDGDKVHCLQWWLKIHKQYPLLFKMVTSILSNFNAPNPLGTGCKLNVLCTFNLRPVSRGKVESSFSIMVVDKKCGRMNMETYSSIQTIKNSLEANRSAKQISLHNSFLKFNLYTSRLTS